MRKSEIGSMGVLELEKIEFLGDEILRIGSEGFI